jgi:type 1 fimbria pilin
MNRYYQVLPRKIVASIFLLFGFSYAGVAVAQDCSYAAGVMRPVKYPIPHIGHPPNTLPYNQTQFTVTGNEQVGKVLWISQLTTGDGSSSVSCGGHLIPPKAMGLSVNTVAIAGYNVIRSNIPGIGIVLVSYNGVPSEGYASYPSSSKPDWYTHSTNFMLYGIKLIRIPGQLSPGTITMSPSSSLLATFLVGDNRLPFAEFYYGLSSSMEGGGGGTCRFSVSPNPVDMGSVPLNSLSVGGSSPEKIINITATNCSKTNARMSVRPMVATIGTNCSGQMENAGSARGVGIALSYDGPDTYVPVCWNRDFTPWEDIRSPTMRRYRFSVAMRRFQQNATGGTVQGRIIVTVNYP